MSVSESAPPPAPIPADRLGAAALLQVGRLRVDLENRTVSGPDGPSGLHRRAEELLLFLCQHPNALVTRERILSAVWGGRPVEEAAVSNCIWQIRKALGEDAKAILQTRAKQGYWLVLSDHALSDATPLHAAPVVDAARPRAASFLRSSGLLRMGWFALALCTALAAALALGWRPLSAPKSSVQRDLTLSMGVPPNMPWLNDLVLKETIMAAALRRSGATLFDSLPQRSVFSDDHVHIHVSEAGVGSIAVDILVRQGKTQVRESLRSSPATFQSDLRAMLRKQLRISSRQLTQAEHDYSAGMLAELRYDALGAIVAYRRAFARDPRLFEANIAMARLLHSQGRSLEARAAISRIENDAALDPAQRCRLQALVAQVAPERYRDPGCALAGNQMRRYRGQWQALIDSADRAEAGPQPAGEWFQHQFDAIAGTIAMGDFVQAEARIARAERIARDVGWNEAVLEIGVQRALAQVYQGRLLQAAAQHRLAADGYRRIGDAERADFHQLFALRALPAVLGEQAARMRVQLREIVERSRRCGNIANELEALQLLARIDRGDLDAWQAHLDRLRYLGETAIAPELRAQNTLYIFDEYRFQRRYTDVLDGLKRLGTLSAMDAKIWESLLRIESHFARDELRQAVDVVQRMERDGIDPSATGSACHFAWLFAEAGMSTRSLESLRQCADQPFDRIGQATRGDYAYLAEARIRRGEGLHSEAWAVLSPRIASLLAQEAALPQEIESMLLLSRHAVGLPGADPKLLHRALARGEAALAQDGSGPGLRFGVHMLRWRLCAAERRSDCGPVLPQWALQDRFEARLARESAGQTSGAPASDGVQSRRPVSRAAR